MRIIPLKSEDFKYTYLNYSDFLTTNTFEYEKASFIGEVKLIDLLATKEETVNNCVLPSDSSSVKWENQKHSIEKFKYWNKTIHSLFKKNCNNNIYRVKNIIPSFVNKEDHYKTETIKEDILRLYRCCNSPAKYYYNSSIGLFPGSWSYNNILLQHLTKKQYSDAFNKVKTLVYKSYEKSEALQSAFIPLDSVLHTDDIIKRYLTYLYGLWEVTMGFRDGIVLSEDGTCFYTSTYRKLIPVKANITIQKNGKRQFCILNSFVFEKDKWKDPICTIWDYSLIERDVFKNYGKEVNYSIYSIEKLQKDVSIEEIKIKQILEAMPMKSIKDNIRVVNEQLEQNKLDPSYNWDILLELNKENAIKTLKYQHKLTQKLAKQYVDIIWNVFFNGRKPDKKQKNNKNKPKYITIHLTKKDGSVVYEKTQSNGLYVKYKKEDKNRILKPVTKQKAKRVTKKNYKPVKVLKEKRNNAPDKMISVKKLSEDGLIVQEVDRIWRTSLPNYIELGWTPTSKGTYKSFKAKETPSFPAKSSPVSFKIDDDKSSPTFGKRITIYDESKTDAKRLRQMIASAKKLKNSGKLPKLPNTDSTLREQ
jgi:hypothetical protein